MPWGKKKRKPKRKRYDPTMYRSEFAHCGGALAQARKVLLTGELEKIRAMHIQGKQSLEIAKTLNISRSKVLEVLSDEFPL